MIRRALPWFESPLAFLHSAEAMEWESGSLDENAGDDWESRYFHVTRTGHRLGLPWLDAGLAFCIAVNRVPGTTWPSPWTTAASTAPPRS